MFYCLSTILKSVVWVSRRYEYILNNWMLYENSTCVEHVYGKGADKEVRINESEQRVIDFISQSLNITIKELVQVNGYSDGNIRKMLVSLKDKNVIEHHGGNKVGERFIISPKMIKVLVVTYMYVQGAPVMYDRLLIALRAARVRDKQLIC